MTVTEAQRAAWSSVPVDDVGYLPSAQLLALGDDELRAVVAQASRNRYGGWRNHEGRWLAWMNLDEASGKRVLDYGCGLGADALRYAQAGARVMLADIVAENVALAARVLRLHGCEPDAEITVPDDPAQATLPGLADIVHMSGVLHHVPDPLRLVGSCHGWLRRGGELRLMVYSDEGWRVATGTEPPADTAADPGRLQFVRFFDAVGDWADWYDAARLAAWYGCWFALRDAEYITPDRRYLTAVMVREDCVW